MNKTLLQIKISSTCNTYVLLESISACIRCINIWVQVLSENLCDFSKRIFTWVQILQENLYYNTWVQVLRGMNGIGKKTITVLVLTSFVIIIATLITHQIHMTG